MKDEEGTGGSGQWPETSARNSQRTLRLSLPLPSLQALSVGPPDATVIPISLSAFEPSGPPICQPSHLPPRRTCPPHPAWPHAHSSHIRTGPLSLGCPEWRWARWEGGGADIPKQNHIPQRFSRTGPCGYGGCLTLFLLVFISVVLTYPPTWHHGHHCHHLSAATLKSRLKKKALLKPELDFSHFHLLIPKHNGAHSFLSFSLVYLFIYSRPLLFFHSLSVCVYCLVSSEKKNEQKQKWQTKILFF